MKKSLIALAVLAASGASFAQVSLTGNLTYGYQSTSVADVKSNGVALPVAATRAAGLPDSGDTAGLGAETTTVTFTANEDLGGGFSAKAELNLSTKARAASQGEDHKLTLVTPVGAVILGTAQAPDYLSGGIAGVGAYYAGWDGTTTKLFTTRTNRDFAAFVIPVGAMTFAVSQHEGAGEVAFGSGMTGGTTAAGSGNSTGAAINGGSTAPVTTLSATYSAGPLVANGQYAVYKNSAAIVGVSNNNAKDTTRLAASYDLGMVKLGGGLVITNHTSTGANSPKTSDYLVAAKVPMGASSFGLTYASRTYADMTQGYSATGTGYSLEYGYAMSKRTSVIANYGRWTPVAAMSAATSVDASSQYQLLLSHSF
jgi:hypothetical protein